MNFDEFMKAAWNDHADRAAEVAARLAASLHVVETASQIPRYASLVTHVYGEHLGQWSGGVALHQALRGSPAFDGSPDARGAIARGIAALNYCAGDGSSLVPLAKDDRVSVLAVVSSAKLGQHDHAGALAAYDALALALRATGDTKGYAASRAQALACYANVPPYEQQWCAAERRELGA